MHVGVKLGAGLAAAVLAGGTLSGGALAAAEQPPPNPENVQAPQEEGRGPGAIMVGPKGAAEAMERLGQDRARSRWCHGKVLPENGLNVRTGPGLGYHKVTALEYGTRVRTDWDTIERRDGYLWVRMKPHRWIADYKIGHGNGKWYVKYFDC
ncbi:MULTISPECIES: SH3 domain-containing protein [unclassified Spirillospora]|uniref:SH3 domain-containing protein n=1 Tax=unclassified Spirillospora TaxID=2642701 RepID=UPI0037116B49